jgi:tRNA-uridine 2-sulfurtransferase
MKSKKVYLMLSGGVDSSVAAADLRDQGYQVVCVFMQCWSQVQLLQLGLDPTDYACAWEEDAQDAALVAQKLDLPFEIWDFRQDYYKNVVEYMVNEYKNGKTPNPDVMCNSTIKFGVFYERARAAGADFVATGHYARSVMAHDGSRELWRGIDDQKDQSYFLWRIGQDMLLHSLFPIGEYATKSLVRQRATHLGLITAAKPDSQGICFIGDTPLREILLKVLGSKPGFITDTTGNTLGSHRGAFLYTIGQREGLGLGGGPWFVQAIDVEKNTVTVVHERDKQMLTGTTLRAHSPNWLTRPHPHGSFAAQAQIRYRQAAHDCTVTILSDNTLVVTFVEPISAITPGQSLVLYDSERVIGGAIIG